MSDRTNSYESATSKKKYVRTAVLHLHLADAFIQSDLHLHSGYTFSLVSVFPGNRTHNLLRCWCNALPLSHTGTVLMMSSLLATFSVLNIHVSWFTTKKKFMLNFFSTNWIAENGDNEITGIQHMLKISYLGLQQLIDSHYYQLQPVAQIAALNNAFLSTKYI